MEDTLREQVSKQISQCEVVLILVLMEDTLRVGKTSDLKTLWDAVLILVLMEDTLRG